MPTVELREAATAIARLKEIFKLDSQVVSRLENLSLQLADIQKQIELWRSKNLQSLAQMLGIVVENSEDNFKHPTDQIVIIKRFVDKWKPLRSALNVEKVCDSLKNLDDELSSRGDLKEAMTGLTRLGRAYRIPARNFSEGVIQQFQSRLKFDHPEDLFQMGEFYQFRKLCINPTPAQCIDIDF